MQITSRTLFRTAAAATAATLLAVAPSAAAAQQTLQPVRVTADRAALADRLEAEAQALPSELSRFGTAARLYEQAAEARPFDAPKTAHALRTAAFYRYYSGDSDRSLRLLERAAESSLALGDLVSAANAFIDAAFVASEVRQGEHSMELAQRAERLTRSPLLDSTQRDGLRMRISGPKAVAFFDHP